MKFSLLLFALGQILKIANLFHGRFKRHIRKTKARILIKTSDGNRGRIFVFNKGCFSSSTRDLEEYDAALVFRNADSGFRVLTDKKKDAAFSAAARGDLTVEGMSFWAQWFEDATRLVM